jgi:ABC-type transporter MlaC component
VTYSFFKTIRNISQSALLITAGLLASPSYAEQNNPLHLLEKVTNTTFERIESERQDIKSDPNHIRAII